MAKNLTWPALRAEYEDLWATCELRPSKMAAAKVTAKKIAANRSRYEEVAGLSNVPWYVIGLIHAMECGLSFSGHLHNGDSLKARTWQVPKGRPKTGTAPFTWEESACDAMKFDGLDKVDDWTPARMCYELERYNGVGYLRYHPEVKSPYLWSGTNHYARGKYVADGKWDSNAVSGQSGAIAILKCLMELEDGILTEDKDDDHFVIPAADPEKPTPVKPKDLVGVSRKATWISRLTKALHTIWIRFSLASVLEYFGVAKETIDQISQVIQNNAIALTIGGAVLGALALKYVLGLMAEDVNEGRATPSGEAGSS